jgi:hypothetical protein
MNVMVPIGGALIEATVCHETETTITALSLDRLTWWFGKREEVTPCSDS